MVVDALHSITTGACSRHPPIFFPRNAAKYISRLCRSLIFCRLSGIFCIHGENHFQDSTKNLTAYNYYLGRSRHRDLPIYFHRHPTDILFRHTTRVWAYPTFVVVRSNGSLRLYCRHYHEAERLSTVHGRRRKHLRREIVYKDGE